MKEFGKILMLGFSIFILVFSTGVVGSSIKNTIEVETSNLDLPYTGTLRIYVVEPTSRWDNYDDEPYHYALLDLNSEKLSIEYLDTYSKQLTWNAQDAGYNNVQQNNIMVIATLFNPQSQKAYAYPPSQNEFNAHYVDAAAAAKPGETGYNTKNDDYTHTAFVEEPTATWCQYCPAMADTLNNIFDSEEYPFYYVALVTDKEDDAESRASELNLYGYPTAYFDGGKSVLVGGVTNENSYISKIENCITSDVHDLDLSINVEWTGNGIMDITIDIKNNEETLENYAPSMPIIEGPTRNGRPNKEQVFTFVSDDPEGKDVYYYIDWGDGEKEEWIGPYASGEVVTVTHTWTEENTYNIKAKSRDSDGIESDEATLEFSVPRVRLNSWILDFILERFPILKLLF